MSTRTSASGRTFHCYIGWSALPAGELTALKMAAIRGAGSNGLALTDELVALIDGELARRAAGPSPETPEPP